MEKIKESEMKIGECYNTSEIDTFDGEDSITFSIRKNADNTFTVEGTLHIYFRDFMLEKLGYKFRLKKRKR